MQQEGAYLIKVKLTYRDLKEKEEALKALERIFIVKNISKEYSRKKASDVYVDLELMA